MAKCDHIWYVALQKNDAIFDYAMIEAGCSDNPGVRIKEVRISEGPLYTCLYSAVPPYVTDAAAEVESILQERSCSHPPLCSLPPKESIHPQKHCEICESSGNIINDIFAHNFASFLLSRT